jgi:dipeptidyl-peptidase-4
MTIADPSRPESTPDQFRYPRPGKTNADVRLFLTSADSGTPLPVSWDHARFPYVATVTWTANAPPTIVVFDRLQETEQVLAIDERTGKTRPLVEEKDAAWVNQDPSVPRWLDDGSAFLWSSERSGRWELELHGASGELTRVLVKGDAGYRALAGIDATKHLAIVNAGSEPTEGVVLAVPLDGSASRVLASAKSGEVTAAEGFVDGAWVSNERALHAMPHVSVRASDGAALREVPSSVESPAELPHVELTRAGADEMRVAIVRPRSFDPKRRYAILDAAYAGPHANVVQSDASIYLHEQWLADACDLIVVAIDAKGTPNRDRTWERAIDGKLGSVALEGHVAALDALAAKYPELDRARVGVSGWSFGGYFAGFSSLSRPDVYKAAILGAPVVDWRDYDTAYTERYLGLPDEKASDYEASSLLTLASRPSAHPAAMLLVHGTADDNVYFFHSLKLASALERAHVSFEFLPLPGVTHMLPADAGLTEATWLRAVEFLRRELGPSTPGR